MLVWEVGKIDQTKLPNIRYNCDSIYQCYLLCYRGSVNLVTGATPEDTNPSISVQFAISQLAVSGLKVNRYNYSWYNNLSNSAYTRLDMYGEKYKPFKGVKYLTKAGRFQVRM